MSPWRRAYVGLGSNLDDPLRQVRCAMTALQNLAAIRNLRCSALYRSAPVGFAAQPDFINAVCACETQLDAQALLDRLLDIERAQGRVRDQHKNGPRTLDLDLLLYDDCTMTTPTLTLPHPRLHERAFVLYPLAEIDPDLVIPGRCRVADLLPGCSAQRLERLAS